MIGINMKNIESANAGTYPKPKAGGYVCIITDVTNNPPKKRLDIMFDFYEGEFKDYYKDLSERAKFWGGKFSKSYSEKALPFLKQFIETVVASNSDTYGLVIGDYEDIDETKLVGKLFGAAIGEKEYMGNDGIKKVKLDTYNAQFYTVDDINAGNYQVPEFKKYEDSSVTDMSAGVVDLSAGFGPVKDDDIPF